MRMRPESAMLIAVMLVLAHAAFAGGGQEGGEPAEGDGPRVVEITVWAIGNQTDRWRADIVPEAAESLNAELEAEGANVRVEAEGVLNDYPWSDYKRRYTLAAENGSAPEIVLSGHGDIASWGQAGHISPIADSVSEVNDMHANFADVFDSLWNSTVWDGKIWAIPQDTEARPMFFNKPKLAELGWSQSEIDSLPDRIQSGEFTLADLVDTAEQAVLQGVVEAGYGYWHRPSKGSDFLQYYVSHGGEIYDADEKAFIIDQEALERFYTFQREIVERGVTPRNFIGTDWSIWHETVSTGNALFWNGGIWHWAEWSAEYVQDIGGREYLRENVGYALQPAGDGGEPGTLSHPLVYMVSSERASGNDNHDLIARLLAHMTTAELNTRHAVESAHLAIVESQMDHPDYQADEFLSDVTYMLDHNYYQPNDPLYGVWFEVVWGGMVSAQQGETSPEQAAADVVEQLELELGDNLTVR